MDKIRQLDWGLNLGVILLLCFGIVVISSTSPAIARDQIIFAVLGYLLYSFLFLIDYRLIRPFIIILYFLNLILLVLTYFYGEVSRGAARWFALGGFTFQPSEISKLVIILALAHYFSSAATNPRTFKSFLFALLLIAVPAVFIFLQPDLGTALVIFAIFIGVALMAGVSTFYLFGFGALAAALSVPVFFLLKEYQRHRIITFINPMLDPLGRGYQVIQSVIAIGSGGLLGRGFGQGTQSHLKFLPAYNNDFIFASLTEEWGFIGSVILLLLYILVFWRILEIARTAADDFGVLLTVGVFSMLFFQMAVNIGMNLGLTPITGIPLPLISSGGSSLIVTLVALGFIQNVAFQRKT